MAQNNTSTRLDLNTPFTWSDIFCTLVKPGEEELNRGAFDCLICLMTYRGTTHAINSVIWLDKIGIYDDNLGIFWLKICQRRWDIFDSYIENFRKGTINKDEMHQKLAEFRHSA